MALTITKPLSLKERLLQKAAEQAPAKAVFTQEKDKDLELTLTVQVPVIADAIKVEEANTTIDTGSLDGQDFISDTAAQQAYADILPRIDGLVALSGEALGAEMTILKKALIQNPDACALMLPEDIGKMVAALRTITGQALTEAASKPKGGKRQKPLALTAEAMEAAFEEL